MATARPNQNRSTAKKAPAKKAAPAKAKAPARKAAPAVLSAKEAGKIKPAAHLKADQAARVGDAAGDGYVVRWPKAGHDLLLKTDAADADASKWLVRCNAHGTTLAVSGAKQGDEKGRAAERATWCPGCKKAKTAKAKAAAK